jgi:hypothetical protein
MLRPARLAAILLLFVVAGCSTRPPAAKTDSAERRQENPWPHVAAELRRDSDILAVRRVLDQLRINLVNSTDPQFQPDTLDAAHEGQLRKLLNLTDRDIAEIRPASFTGLDAYHLAECYYLRDAARSLGVAGLPPERQARLAFDWVVRQVTLSPLAANYQGQRQFMPPAAPSLVLGRGAGSGLERAYVFIALVKQLGLDGCLVGPPDAALRPWSYAADPMPNVPPRGPFWAVGVRVTDAVLLFDPWRGEPVPGPMGGIATLAQVAADPTLLSPWRADKAAPWLTPHDVVAKSVPFLTASLSSLAPRLTRLEAEIANDAPGVKLTTDAAAFRERFAPATPYKAVGFWNPPEEAFSPTETLASFVPPAEGGLGLLPDLLNTYRASQVPFESFAMPAVLLPKGPAASGELPDPGVPEAVERLRVLCISAYGNTFLASPTPRERIQRGQFAEVAPLLVQRRSAFTAGLERLRTDRNRDAKLVQWAEAARDAYTKLLRARDDAARASAAAEVEAFWKADGATVSAIVDAAISEAGAAEATYLLALCRHEQAERAELTADRAAGTPAEARARARAAEDWSEAAGWWGRYAPFAATQARHFPARPAQAERLAAEARATH